MTTRPILFGGPGASATGRIEPSADGVYTYTYTVAGIYTVTLYVIDSDGSMSSVWQIISVT